MQRLDWWSSANSYLYSQCTCIRISTQRDFVISGCASERRVGIDNRVKRRGQGLKTWGKATNKPQEQSQLVDQSNGARPKQNKRALFLTSHIQSEWCGHRWHRVRGHMAKYGVGGGVHGDSRYWTLKALAHSFNNNQAVRGGKKNKAEKDATRLK